MKEEKQLAAMRKKYSTGVTVYDPGNMGYVMVSSETPNASATDMIQEFGMDTFDEYIRYSVEVHNIPDNQGEHCPV